MPRGVRLAAIVPQAGLATVEGHAGVIARVKQVYHVDVGSRV